MELVRMDQNKDFRLDTTRVSKETLMAGNKLMLVVNQSRREKWLHTVSRVVKTRNSKKAWTSFDNPNNNF